MTGRPPLEGPWLQRDAAVRLRRESWGGVAFHRATGDLFELDAEAFDVLRALSVASTPRTLHAALRARGASPRLPELAGFVAAMHARGVVMHASPDAPALPPDPLDDTAVATAPGALRAPLVAHWAVTWRCNLQCSFCYAESGPWREHEPPAALRVRIARRLARWGVLEVAIGGGEPTLLADLPDLLATIRAEAMVPNVTTNGVAASEALVAALAAHAGVVHLSADEPGALDDARGAGVSRRLRATGRRLRDAGVRFGVNLLLTPRHVGDLRRSLDASLALGASSVTLLRPKGAWAAAHWPGFPSARDVEAIARELRAFVHARPPVRLAVDTALRSEWAAAGLLDDPEPGVLGCGGGQRHVALTPDGDLHPCSHARRAGYRMGNVLVDDLDALWADVRSGAGRGRYLADCDGARCPCRELPRRLLPLTPG